MSAFRLLVPCLVLTPEGAITLDHEMERVHVSSEQALICYPDGSYEVLEREDVFFGQFRLISHLEGKDLAGLYAYSTESFNLVSDGIAGTVGLATSGGREEKMDASIFSLAGKVWACEDEQSPETLRGSVVEVEKSVEFIARACNRSLGWDLQDIYMQCA